MCVLKAAKGFYTVHSDLVILTFIANIDLQPVFERETVYVFNASILCKNLMAFVRQAHLESHARQPGQICGPDETTGRPEAYPRSHVPRGSARVALHKGHSHPGGHSEIGSVLCGAIHRPQGHQPHRGSS